MDEFKYKNRIKIDSSDSNQPEIHFLNGMYGIYLSKANDEESVVRLYYEEQGTYLTMTVNNKYIKLLTEDEIIKKDLAEDIKRYNREKDREENFIPKLQELLGIADDVKFHPDNDLACRCYFKNGKLFLIEKHTDTIIKDVNLRNKIFYGLATGTIKPIVGKLTAIPKDGFKYYFWDTTFDEYMQMENSHDHAIINWDYWKGSIKDYMCFYVGNCFPTREACEKNYSLIERIKNVSLKNTTSKNRLIVGPAKVAIPILGTVKHKAIRLNKTVGAYILECGKDELGHRRYFAVLDKDFSEASPGAPIEERFSSLLDLPNTEYKPSEEN